MERKNDEKQKEKKKIKELKEKKKKKMRISYDSIIDLSGLKRENPLFQVNWFSMPMFLRMCMCACICSSCIWKFLRADLFHRIKFQRVLFDFDTHRRFIATFSECCKCTHSTNFCWFGENFPILDNNYNAQKRSIRAKTKKKKFPTLLTHA